MSLLTSRRLECVDCEFRAPVVEVVLVAPGTGLDMGIPAKAFVDTGADFSVATQAVLERVRRVAAIADVEHLLAPLADLCSSLVHLPVRLAFSSAAGSRLMESPVGIARAEGHTAALLDRLDVADMLLGRDFLSQLVVFNVGESVTGGPMGGRVEIRSS